ncbi:Rieske (2Fe-2S) protein [Jiulongibacter sediminis]|uniref:Rieske (2Fe-2S) protein n=1 Tax=Jiulongibacter sediminis TaxID=1605367 RepID=UPI0006DCAB51|nr:Rieske 2Fe-2S domain-containing protein [Jiulongibacter sediminis]
MEKSAENISRLQFLKSLGLGGSALMAVYLSSCVNEIVGPSGATNTLDLNDAANAGLLSDGGYVILGNIVVANIGGGQYAAVTRICSHEGQKKVVYRNGEFYCSAHGARFSNTGSGLNSTGSKGLTTYDVSQNGSVLTIS